MGLDIIGLDSKQAALRIGAMATRSALAQADEAQAFCGGMIVQGTRRWGGNVQRNRATVGGAIATAAGDDPLVAALLVCNTTVSLYGREGVHAVPLVDFLPRRRELLAAPALITEVVVPESGDHTGAAMAGVARTPADTPIVLAVAVLTVATGTCLAARLALGGVAETPLILPQIEAALVNHRLTPDLIADAAAQIAPKMHPTGDHRGSAEYRRAMVEVLVRRALNEAWLLC